MFNFHVVFCWFFYSVESDQKVVLAQSAMCVELLAAITMVATDHSNFCTVISILAGGAPQTLVHLPNPLCQIFTVVQSLLATWRPVCRPGKALLWGSCSCMTQTGNRSINHKDSDPSPQSPKGEPDKMDFSLPF